MTPERLAEQVRRVADSAVATVEFGQVTVEVASTDWSAAAAALRDDPDLDCSFFDWLSAHDAGPDADVDSGLCVVLHVWSLSHRHHVLLRTRVARDHGRLASLVEVWPGAAWHERETFEMFGVVFDGHPNLVPLLLPDGFEGHPLRKDFVLASRVAKSWPGAKEPGESDRDTEGASPGRRRMLPPGVPAPGEWGPGAPSPEPPS
jgi:NADH-quinone oxidoreductase subunit C